jgi:hypothetical protein
VAAGAVAVLLIDIKQIVQQPETGRELLWSGPGGCKSCVAPRGVWSSHGAHAYSPPPLAQVPPLCHLA